jgi:hypothetical protein
VWSGWACRSGVGFCPRGAGEPTTPAGETCPGRAATRSPSASLDRRQGARPARSPLRGAPRGENPAQAPGLHTMRFSGTGPRGPDPKPVRASHGPPGRCSEPRHALRRAGESPGSSDLEVEVQLKDHAKPGWTSANVLSRTAQNLDLDRLRVAYWAVRPVNCADVQLGTKETPDVMKERGLRSAWVVDRRSE